VAATALVVLGACGSDAVEPTSQTPSTSAPRPAATSPTTTAAPPVASLTPVTPIAPDPSIPLPGVCTQGGDSSTCPPDPERADAVRGLTEDQAAAEATAHGWPFRVVERDGEEFLVTQDYVANRLNVAIRAGTVERAWFG
jgi:hypothetical protein